LLIRKNAGLRVWLDAFTFDANFSQFGMRVHPADPLTSAEKS
jgi:hypothetical protein